VNKISRHDTASANMTPWSVSSASQPDQIPSEAIIIVPNYQDEEIIINSHNVPETHIASNSEQQEGGCSELSGNEMEIEPVNVVYRRSEHLGESYMTPTRECEMVLDRDLEITVNASHHQWEMTCGNKEEVDDGEQHLECLVLQPADNDETTHTHGMCN